MNKKKINFYVIFLIIALSYIIFVISYDHYNSIDFIDHDEGYLIEQLLLKIGIFDLNKVVTSAAEYGVDFYYFKVFFLGLNYLYDLETIDIFRLKTIINTFASIYAFFIVYKIFDLLKLQLQYYLLFLLLVISTPEIFRLCVSLKPDLNLLFFSLVLTNYFFLKSHINLSKNYYYLFLFFLALSLSIKAWAFPFVILLLINKNYYFNNFSKFHKFLFLIILFAFFYLINLYLLTVKEFIFTNNDFINFFKENQNNYILLNINNLLQNYFYFVLALINLFFLTILFLSIGNKKYQNIFKKIFIFGIIWFILWYPYISDLSTFTKTIIEDSYSTILNKNSIVYNYHEGIIYYFFIDLINFKLNFGILFVLIISPLLVIIYKNKLNKNLNIIFYLMLTTFSSLTFVNYITDYHNQYPAKYLYFIFLYIFIMYLINELRELKFIKLAIIPLIYFSCFIMILQNFNTFINYKKFLLIENDISNMILNHEKEINFKNKKLISCGTIYPANEKNSDINLIPKHISECFDDNFLVTLNNNDLIYFEYIKDNKNIILNKFVLVYEDEYLFPDRFGKNQVKKNQFFKKKIN